MNKIKDVVDIYSAKDDTYELECVFVNITKDMFDRSIKYCRALSDVQVINNEPSLDISFPPNMRITLNGPTNISSYCRSNSLEKIDRKDISIIRKSRSDTPSVYLENNNLRINLKKEDPIHEEFEVNNILKNLEFNDKKYFRYKKRYSFIHKRLRYDLTVTKSSFKDKARTIGESGVLKATERYEVEIEVLEKPKKGTSFASKFEEAIMNLYGYINNAKYVITEEEKHHTRYSYLELAYDANSISKFSRDDKTYFNMLKETYNPNEIVDNSIWSKFHVGPKPVTLEKKNILPAGIDVITIRNDYFATEKADGERMSLFVNKKGRCYLIDSLMNVTFTGVTIPELKDSIIDGEYIPRNSNYPKIYAIFDVYYYKGNKTSLLPFVFNKEKLDKITITPVDGSKSRLEILQKIIHHKDRFNDFILIKLKKFLYEESIFKSSEELLQSQFEYNTDGIIYTPLYYPVGGYFLGDKEENIRTTWRVTYKWKPSILNTIDFKVSFDKKDVVTPIYGNMSLKCRSLSLYVGYNSFEEMNATLFLEKNYKKKDAKGLTLFTPGDAETTDLGTTFIEVNDNGEIKCQDGSVITDNSIVEFRYDIDEPRDKFRWRPLRLRRDKTEPNFNTTAINVWKSIQEPVTKEMITTNGISYLDIVKDDVYYDRKIPRDKLASINMTNFHNNIKEQILKFANDKAVKDGKESRSLMDIACGKGGDLQKWERANFTKIFGVDLSRNNIEDTNDGIYARIIDRKERNPNKYKDTVKFVFLTMDASHKLDTTYIANMNNKDDKRIAEIIWNIKQIPSDDVLSKYSGYVKPKFHVLSCQFSIHYFFKSEDTLNNFLYNVDSNLKPGGIFVGTCLDGKKVKKLLKNEEKVEGYSGFHNERLMWQIKKKYTDEKDDFTYGEKIDIYMESINKVLTEYLVNFDLLVDKLNKLNITLIEPTGDMSGDKTFEQYYTKYNNNPRNKALNENEKVYSFLNRTFIFIKAKDV